MSLPYELTASQAAHAMRERRLTSEQLVRSCLDRIAAQEPLVQAWAAIDAERAMATARAFDAQPARGPLHGVPIGVKDVIATGDLPTQYNSPIYRGHQPPRDASVVARARRAGLVVIGKTATQEFATRGRASPTRNPWSPGHTPGGSSSGSAAAVAALMVPLAISTQTAGSIIRPASYCGVVGFKPTFDAIDTAGMKPIVPSFDTLGVHARSMGDAALALQALSDWTGMEEFSHGPPASLRISVCRAPFWAHAETATRNVLDLVARRLGGAGAQLRDTILPQAFNELGAAHDTISDYEARQSLAYEWDHCRAGLSPGLRAKLARGAMIAGPAYRRACRIVDECRAAGEELFHDCDCLLTPSAPGLAPPFSDTELGSSVFSKLWTTLGMPSVNVPVPAAGPLPIGVQIVARPGCDTLALQVAGHVGRIVHAP
ncbi:amidase [Pollutimonas bauzanensis]|uniref:Asp-tRNAAsn/Glu-tRNAGln amidotransferase A subunit n=1 Tax=Pollutimonas bauzanensis TaxID=658167 RepID=A0A1M5UY82_9BURK|nr:amidase [Pollutimonas bauzanensis]SHH67890.1 Asp-tRNAAsn/Glu-tRNAGln amidotransferase A subunit [Pollutimonas bauzanensis]